MKVVNVKNKVIRKLANIDPSGGIANFLEYKKEKENPLMIFGPGIYQYFNLLGTLIRIFLFMSLIAAYQMWLIYSSNPNYLG